MAEAERLFLDKYPYTTILKILLDAIYVILPGEDRVIQAEEHTVLRKREIGDHPESLEKESERLKEFVAQEKEFIAEETGIKNKFKRMVDRLCFDMG